MHQLSQSSDIAEKILWQFNTFPNDGKFCLVSQANYIDPCNLTLHL